MSFQLWKEYAKKINWLDILVTSLLILGGFSFGFVKGINYNTMECNDFIIDSYLTNPQFDSCFGYRRHPSDEYRLIPHNWESLHMGLIRGNRTDTLNASKYLPENSGIGIEISYEDLN